MAAIAPDVIDVRVQAETTTQLNVVNYFVANIMKYQEMEFGKLDYVVKANEQKSGFGENVARVPAGAYQLTIDCGLYIDTRFFEYETVVQATLSAGRVYHLRAAPEGRRCEPSIEDTQGKNG